MTDVKTFSMRLLFTSLSFLIPVEAILADPSDNFNFRLGDSFQTVSSMIDRLDPYDCKRKKGFFNHPVSFEDTVLFPVVSYKKGIFANIENQNVIRITHSITNNDCSIARLEFLNFCKSSGSLIFYEVRYPLEAGDDITLDDVLHNQNYFFIGADEDEVVVDSNFSRYAPSFTVFSKKNNLYRNSFAILSGKQQLVNHAIFRKTNDNLPTGKIQLCSEGEDRLTAYKPKYKNLGPIFRLSAHLINKYEARRKSYNACIGLLLPEKQNYIESLRRFEQLNYLDISYVKNLVEQIQYSESNPYLEEKYEGIFNYVKQLPHVLDGTDLLIDPFQSILPHNLPQKIEMCKKFYLEPPTLALRQEYPDYGWDLLKNVEIK